MYSVSIRFTLAVLSIFLRTCLFCGRGHKCACILFYPTPRVAKIEPFLVNMILEIPGTLCRLCSHCHEVSLVSFLCPQLKCKHVEFVKYLKAFVTKKGKKVESCLCLLNWMLSHARLFFTVALLLILATVVSFLIFLDWIFFWRELKLNKERKWIIYLFVLLLLPIMVGCYDSP